MKSPAFSLYVRDMLCSQTVSKLHSKSYSKDGSNPHSRGFNAYMFLLLSSWLEDSGPSLPNDDEELMAMARVTPIEWEAIKPTVMSKFQLNTEGRWVNERLWHEWEKQQSRKLNGSKGGSKKVANRVAKLKPSVSSSFASSSSSSIPVSTSPSISIEKTDAPAEGSKDKGTLKEVTDFCLSLGMPEDNATWFFFKCEGNGWKNNGKPIKDWKATIRAWKTAGYMRGQNGHKTPEPGQLQESITAPLL